MCIMCSHETHNLVRERENGHYPTTFRYGCSNHLWERSSQSSSSFSFKLSGCSCWIWWTSFISSVVWVWRYVLWRLETFARLYHHLTSHPYCFFLMSRLRWTLHSHEASKEKGTSKWTTKGSFSSHGLRFARDATLVLSLEFERSAIPSTDCHSTTLLLSKGRSRVQFSQGWCSLDHVRWRW